MRQLDSIWSRGRADLMLTTEHGDLDAFLWEHSVRVAQSAQQITKLPMLQEQSPDELVVVAAALYHDAAWVIRVRDGDLARHEIIVRAPADNHLEQGARMMERSLAKVLAPDVLERASRALRTFKDRDAELIEARIVAEAENLDEFGLLSLWPTIRRGALEGKGVQAAIDTWHRRAEYHFWTARLDDSFRFPPVRAIARQRLEKLERLMGDLQEQQHGADISLALADTRRDGPKTRARS